MLFAPTARIGRIKDSPTDTERTPAAAAAAFCYKTRSPYGACVCAYHPQAWLTEKTRLFMGENFYSVSQLSQQPAPHPYSYYVRRRRLMATHPTNARLYLAFHHFSPQGVIS